MTKKSVIMLAVAGLILGASSAFADPLEKVRMDSGLKFKENAPKNSRINDAAPVKLQGEFAPAKKVNPSTIKKAEGKSKAKTPPPLTAEQAREALRNDVADGAIVVGATVGGAAAGFYAGPIIFSMVYAMAYVHPVTYAIVGAVAAFIYVDGIQNPKPPANGTAAGKK